MRLLIVLLLFFSIQNASASIFDLNLWKADSELKEDNYSEAVNEYLKIQAKDPANTRLNYNLGIGLYRLGAYDNAAFNFQQTAMKTKSSLLKERALYNLGNSLFQKEDYENAIKAYEAALKIDPDDEDTKFNLELAKKKLKEKEQNKDEPNKDNQNQNQQQNKQDQQKQDQDKQNQDKKDQQKKDQQDQNKQNQNNQQKKDQQNQQQQPKPRKGGLSEQELKMLLQQVKEGEPKGEAMGLKSKKNTDKKTRLKPW